MARTKIYEVIYRDLLAQFDEGAMAPGDQLPSEPELAQHYGVSRMTVRQAIDQLVADHRVIRRHGAGTFVAQPTYRRVNRLGPYSDEIGVGAADIGTELKVQEATQPPDHVRERLGLKARQQAVHLVRIRIVDGTPASIQESWLSYALAPALARDELIAGSLYRTLDERWGIRLRWAEQEVSAATADAEQAAWLGVEVGSPLVTITRSTYADGPTPVELALSWTRPEFPLLIRLET